jgi:hypothetical protein
MLIELVCDSETKRPGCVLIQAAYGCSGSVISQLFDTADWLLSPTPKMTRVKGTLEDWKKHADELKLKRSVFKVEGNHPTLAYVTKMGLPYDKTLELIKELKQHGYEISVTVTETLNRYP